MSSIEQSEDSQHSIKNVVEKERINWFNIEWGLVDKGQHEVHFHPSRAAAAAQPERELSAGPL